MSRSFAESAKLIQDNLYAIIDELQSKETMAELGQVQKEAIYKRTKAGSGVEFSGLQKEPLEPLKDSYKRFREKTPKLDASTTPAKSNLTLTGEMLSDIYSTADKAKVTLDFRTLFSQRKAKWAEDGAPFRKPRPFFHITDIEGKRLKDLLRKKMLAFINKLF